MALIVYDVALHMVSEIKPLIDRVARHDRSLASQLRRAASSVALNTGEAQYSRGGNQLARFQDAAGSASETRAALKVALAWGWLADAQVDHVDAVLDRILALLWGLTHRRRRST